MRWRCAVSKFRGCVDVIVGHLRNDPGLRGTGMFNKAAFVHHSANPPFDSLQDFSCLQNTCCAAHKEFRRHGGAMGNQTHLLGVH